MPDKAPLLSQEIVDALVAQFPTEPNESDGVVEIFDATVRSYGVDALQVLVGAERHIAEIDAA